MRALITGGAGYVGSVLTSALIDLGHAVRVVDCGLFGFDHLDPRAELIEGDILDFDANWLREVDGVIHLAGLSNDPMAAFSPSLNYLLNASGAAIVAEAAKGAGVSKFVLGSTCSVYGMDDSCALDEEHPTKPAFPYAISKLMAERMLACLTDSNFRPIILRKGTVVGWSPRMRFDLVVNTMIKTGLTERRIVIHNPDLWRPLIDVEDAADAYIRALEAPRDVTGIFNISSQNYQLKEVGELVANGLALEGVRVSILVERRPDARSYRVVTDKATSVLGFAPKKSMEKTVSEVVRKTIAMSDEEIEDRRHYNVLQFQRLVQEGEFKLPVTGRRGDPVGSSAR